jgi:hypothetical protein
VRVDVARSSSPTDISFLLVSDGHAEARCIRMGAEILYGLLAFGYWPLAIDDWRNTQVADAMGT